jgi:hypothetical protein
MQSRNRNQGPERGGQSHFAAHNWDSPRPGAENRAAAAKTERDRVPEIYQVVIECRHEREQRAVFERMRGEGFRCRVLTL